MTNFFIDFFFTDKVLRKLQMSLPRWSLGIIYKSFITPHLDYTDIIFDQAFNKSFYDNLESV